MKVEWIEVRDLPEAFQIENADFSSFDFQQTLRSKFFDHSIRMDDARSYCLPKNDLGDWEPEGHVCNTADCCEPRVYISRMR